MSADVHIHAMKYIRHRDLTELCKPLRPYIKNDPLLRKIARTPNLWLGSFSGYEMPDAVRYLTETIPDTRPIVVNYGLIKKVATALDSLPNTTRHKVAESKQVIKFLKQFYGRGVFLQVW